MKTAVLFFLIILSGFVLKAQEPRYQSPEYQTTGMLNLLKSFVSLTDQQSEKVTQIYLNHYKSIDSAKATILKRGPNSETVNSVFKMIVQKQLETDNKIIMSLNDDQKIAFEKFAVPRRNSMRIVSVATPVSPR